MKAMILMILVMCVAMSSCAADDPTTYATAESGQGLRCNPCDPADIDQLLDETRLYGEGIFWGSVFNGWSDCTPTPDHSVWCSVGFTACPDIGPCFNYIAQCGGTPDSCTWYR